MPTKSLVVAADLVPWWFAVAFWLCFVALVAVVVRDVRRAGGLRAVIAEIRRVTGDHDGHDRP